MEGDSVGVVLGVEKQAASILEVEEQGEKTRPAELSGYDERRSIEVTAVT